MKDNNFFNLDQLKLTFFYEADCFNLNQLEANIDLNWGWYISIWTNWRLTIPVWGWHLPIWGQLVADIFWSWHIQSVPTGGWQFSWGWLLQSEPAERLTIILWGWPFQSETSVEADILVLRLTCFNLGANNHLLGLTCFNLEADMRLTIISWGWHVSIWRLTWGWHVSIWRLAIIFWGWPFLSEPTGRLTIFF